MIDYLTVADVLGIHADQIERYGGAHGLRDVGVLEAALYRPQTGYYEGVVTQAAALWESLSQSPSFVDGNERTSFACTYTFLAINGIQLDSEAHVTYRFITDLYNEHNFTLEIPESWLRENTVTTHES